MKRIRSAGPAWSVRVREDLAAARKHDPAAVGTVVLVLSYPGLHAVWSHRLAHGIWQWPGVAPRVLARVISQVTRLLTGVEIHPGARIGRRLFIDHGTGIVIDETAEIGDDVMIYQGASLTGRHRAGVKCHPTIGDRVMLGAGCRILGPVVIGADARIGANAVVVTDVPAGRTVVGIPGELHVPPLPPEQLPDHTDPAIWI